MFYTLVSKLPIISNDKSDKKFFKIFLLGSVLYILLHYFLHLKKRNEIVEKIKKYIYYVIGLDLMFAFFMSRRSRHNEEDDEEQVEEHTYSNNEKEDIMKSYEEMKRLQNLRQKTIDQPNKQEDKKESEDKKEKEEEELSEKSPFIKQSRDDNSSKKSNRDKKTKHHKKHRTTSSTSESDDKAKRETDTHIPVYMGDE